MAQLLNRPRTAERPPLHSTMNKNLALAAALMSVAGAAFADPDTGTLSLTSTTLEYSGGPYLVPNPTPLAEPLCLPNNCDTFTLTVDVPEGYADEHPADVIRMSFGWAEPNADFDVYVYDAEGNEVASSPTGDNPEIASMRVVPGTYTIEVITFLPLGDSFHASLELLQASPAGGESSIVRVGSNAVIGGPRIDTFRPPEFLGSLRAAEPTIGVDVGTGDAYMLYTTVTTRTQFDDTTSPATVTWTDVSDPFSAVTDTNDPIFTSDHAVDAEGYPDLSEFTRQFVVQLQLATSNIASSDDFGQTWIPSQGGGQPHGLDNQSMGAGPYPEGHRPITATYRNAVYYCSHSIVNAFCSRSDDGGLTFGPSVPIFTLAQGASLSCNNHGHVKVGPKGTVYVPQETCEGGSGVAVSEDAGQTWEYRLIPNSGTANHDSSAAIARDGTLYVAYTNGNDGRPWVAVSKDQGRSWVQNQPIDGPLGINNTVFPAAVAGDPDRAAVVFHATTTPGDAGAGDFPGVWYTYAAFTYDGGASWEVQEVTPGDPVQRGGVCNSGIACPSDPPNRNLLDFFDAAIDGQGRLIAGYADGCIGACAAPGGPPTYSASGVIARQIGGKPLFAKFDPVGTTVPKAPFISASRNVEGASLSWSEPLDGGSAITGYRIYRGTDASSLERLAETGTKPGYTDASVRGDDSSYHYAVSALNAQGESALSNVVVPELIVGAEESACRLPGITLATDPSGDNVDPSPYTDIEYLAVAEPGELDNHLVFTLKMADLSVLPPGLRWAIRFLPPAGAPAGQDDYYVAMTTEHGPSPTFVYGTTGVISDPALGLVGARVLTELGELDAASGYSADGTIVLVLDKANIGSPVAGEFITGIAASIRAPLTPLNNGIQDDAGDAESYTLAGNQACAAKSAPLALIKATPDSGRAPLEVTLDASRSFSATGSDIQAWIFNFGDGSDVLESDSPVVKHTYTREGFFRPTVRVRDANGIDSSNFAEAQIAVGEAQVNTRNDAMFGGSLGGRLLVILTLLGLGSLLRRPRR